MEVALKRLAAIVVFAAAITGCAHPFVPATALRIVRAQAARLSAPRLGVDLYAETSYPMSLVTTYGTRTLGYIEHGLDAQSVGILWNLCSPGFHSDVVERCAESLSPAALASLAKLAQSDHLSVQLRPIIRVGPPSDWNNGGLSWEGKIRPSDKKKWLASLLAAELPYLRTARSAHVAQFVVATELLAFGYSSYWPTFLASAHATCNCQVSYAENTTQFLGPQRLLPPVRALGADFYPALSLPVTASQAQVTRAWEASTTRVPESRREHTSLDEISILATSGAYHSPADWNLTGPYDPQVQARWFTATCQAAARYHMRAVYFYMIPLDDDPAHPQPFRAFFVKNAGARAINACRKILAKG